MFRLLRGRRRLVEYRAAVEPPPVEPKKLSAAEVYRERVDSVVWIVAWDLR